MMRWDDPQQDKAWEWFGKFWCRLRGFHNPDVLGYCTSCGDTIARTDAEGPTMNSATPVAADKIGRQLQALQEAEKELLHALKTHAMHRLALEEARKDRSNAAARSIADLARSFRESEALVSRCCEKVTDCHVRVVLRMAEVREAGG